MGILPLLSCLGALAVAAQEAPPVEPRPAVAAENHPWLDLCRLEITPRAGVVAFSGDYEADPEAAFGILARAPLPCLSSGLLGLDPQAIGAFLDFTAGSIDRDLPGLAEPDGNVFFASAGLDLTLVGDGFWLLRAEAGVQFGDFGGVTNLDDGVAALLGLSGGIRLTESFRLTLQPQAALGDGGDPVYFLHLGLQIAF